MSLLARLVECGAPADVIAEVAMLIAEKAVSDKAIAERRERDAARQAKKRAADKGECHVTSRDVTPTAVTSQDAPLPPPPPSFPQTPNQPPPPPTPVKTQSRERARAGPIPDDWHPQPFGVGTQCRGVVDAWPPGELERQVEHFTAHHRKTGQQWSSWQDAWKTWVLNARKFSGGSNGHGSRNGMAGSGQPGIDRTTAAANRVLEQIEQGGGGPGFERAGAIALPFGGRSRDAPALPDALRPQRYDRG